LIYFPYDFNIKAASLLLPDWATVEGREVFLKNIHDPSSLSEIEG